MLVKEFQAWFEINKNWLYSSDSLEQVAYSAWCAGIQQYQVAEQSEQEKRGCPECDGRGGYHRTGCKLWLED